MRRAKRWLWSHPRSAAVTLVSLLVLAVNGVAYRHAYAMTHFRSGGHLPGRPETLTALQKAQLLATGVSLPRPINRQNPGHLRLAYEAHRVTSGDGTRLEAWFLPRPRPRG